MAAATAAVLYCCSCGANYLVALQERPDRGWLDAVRHAALGLDAQVVDGTQPSFVCDRCGREHRRTGDTVAEHASDGEARSGG
jgi:hypothetical protein